MAQGRYYKFGDHIFYIKPVFDYFFYFAKEYECEEDKNAIVIENKLEEIQKWQVEHNDTEFPLSYLETLVVHSKIADLVAKDYTFIFHGSTIYVDNCNNGFIFTAPSGTGKSTHVNLLKKVFGDRIHIINDDKPFISRKEDKYFVYGSPWDGKERKSLNEKAALRGIFIIKQSKSNLVTQMLPSEAVMMLIRQIHLPQGEVNTKLGTDLLFKLVKDIPIYELKVNMEIDAPKASMEVMNKLIKGE